tara:strand:+ start:41 stop:196 length:156 start_codon:yes stop_codon:yes gene_type:complete
MDDLDIDPAIEEIAKQLKCAYYRAEQITVTVLKACSEAETNHVQGYIVKEF